MKDKETETLKPCPWCGSANIKVEWEYCPPLDATDTNRRWFAECQQCCAQGPFCQKEPEVPTKWNTRPATMEGRALDALEKLVDHYRPVAPHQHYHGPDCPSLFAKWTDCNCATHADYRDARALLREAGRVK